MKFHSPSQMVNEAREGLEELIYHAIRLRKCIQHRQPNELEEKIRWGQTEKWHNQIEVGCDTC